MSENEIRNSCADFLLYHGFLVLRINSGAAMATGDSGKVRYVSFSKWSVLGDDPQTAGISDLLAFKAGPGGSITALAIECKMPGNTPTEAQVKFMAAWEAVGGVSVVARSVDDLEAVVDED
jgi:hypothetical protein